jgi:hypothetical protein
MVFAEHGREPQQRNRVGWQWPLFRRLDQSLFPMNDAKPYQAVQTTGFRRSSLIRYKNPETFTGERQRRFQASV